MNKKNQAEIRTKIQIAAKNLEGRLPESKNHPSGRNPYAHIPKVIISVLGKSYKDLDDDQLEEALCIIEYCDRNPF